MKQVNNKYPNWSKFVDWFTAHPLRWTRLAYGGALLIMFLALVNDTIPGVAKGTEAWWLTLGLIIGGFVGAMTAPDPSKSEVLTLAEKVLENQAIMLEDTVEVETDKKD